MAGGVHGGGRGAFVRGRGLLCMAGGVHGRGVCVSWQISWETVNERAVRILLECILFFRDFSLLSVNSKSSA